MPEHNGIRIKLVSQYDAMFVPEYHSLIDRDHETHPTTHRIDNYIPNYSSSHFWIRYACDETMQEPEIRFFYFKLFIAGKFAVAWGCGAQDDWCGETFSLPSDTGSATTREKLGLFFPSSVEGDSEGPTFEILVYRAKARRRQEREYASAAVVQGGKGGLRLNPIGIVENREPRKFYAYALTDPKDTPFASFRYHVRTHDELESRGFVKQSVGYSASPTQSSHDAINGRIGYAFDSPSAEFEDAFEQREQQPEHDDEEEDDNDLMLPTVRTCKQPSTRFV